MDKSSSSKSFPSVQAIVLVEIAWAVAALLLFLLFSVPLPGERRPLWYSIGTSVFEAGAYLFATILCFRNWRSPQIVSGRNVWLCIGLGMLCYFIGNLLFSWWEIVFQLEPDVSPGDLFFVPTYLFLIIGMVSAVASRRLNLEIWQWGVVSAIAALGIFIAWWISLPTAATPAQLRVMPPAMAQIAPATSPTAKPVPKSPAAVKASPPAAPSAKSAPLSPSPVAPTAPLAPVPPPGSPSPLQPVPATSTATSSAAPEWAIALGEILKPLKPFFDWFYVIGDILLLVIAATLFLAFWGGRFAQSWRMIAAAALSLYIADIWFKYATRLPDYQSGSLPEVFWVFSGVLFGIGAALEYDLSSRSRSRSGGRRRAPSQ